ncbi:rhomboid family intramembrane serine protease GlpG [Vibrio salinus]|uniref:rhomboid family intramembrane serine protease GlpG n=1 Tax=Vibrio salinus TaxID=2899784 RepID=UPI001E52E2BF|nr:rhomboid family intramembrane serine protease GlpG [Vibrio salinus]MCE0493529.1 rhomboid family intramembrane serine protease GlpG [Vibrio salinus]
MIRLITLNNPRMGQAFIDYMASRHIPMKMVAVEQNSYELLLLNDEYYIEAEAELKHFLSEPNAPRYQAASWSLNTKRNIAFSYASPSLLTLIKSKAGWFTLTIIALSFIIYFLQIFGFEQDVFSLLHFPASSLQQWQLWRWVTHALLHFSVIHIVFNMLWWWQLGGDIEKRVGSGKLIGLFILSSACSGLGQDWVKGIYFGGLSGVVYALVGYIWVMGWKCPQVGLTIQKPVLVFLLVWLVLGFVQPFMAIANTAHLTGLIVGVLFGAMDVRRYEK